MWQIRGSCGIREGPVGPSLRDYAARFKIDLIVMAVGHAVESL